MMKAVTVKNGSELMVLFTDEKYGIRMILYSKGGSGNLSYYSLP